MTGSAPQPGETQQTDGNPWSSADPGAEWWRGDTAAHPTVTSRADGADAADSPEPPGNPVDTDRAEDTDRTDGPERTGDPAPVAAQKPGRATARVKAAPVTSPTANPQAKAPARRARKSAPTAQPSSETPDRPAPDTNTPDDTKALATERPDTQRPDTQSNDTQSKASPAGPHAESSTDVAEAVAGPADAARAAGAKDVSTAAAKGATSHPAAEPARAKKHQANADPRPEPEAEHWSKAKTGEHQTRTGTGKHQAEAEAEDEDEKDDDRRPPELVPDVMVLPEPTQDRNRPTLILNRAPVPGQPAIDHQTPERFTPVRSLQTTSLNQLGADSRLETSPFWLGEDAASRKPAEPENESGEPALPSRLGVPPRRKPPAPRRPASGLLALIVLAMVATFFAWVSAEPLWLAVGHSQVGSATVTRCTGGGMSQRCTGEFTASDGTYTQDGVALLGVEPGRAATGSVLAARMANPDSRQAFVGTDDRMLHLRWTIGVLLVILCGFGIAATTGARRLETARARRRAILTSLIGPLALLIGFLAVSY